MIPWKQPGATGLCGTIKEKEKEKENGQQRKISSDHFPFERHAQNLVGGFDKFNAFAADHFLQLAVNISEQLKLTARQT